MQVLNLVKPKLERTKMICDECIDPKMMKYPAIECALSQCNFTILAGKQGQGKTSLFISMMRKGGPLYHCYNHIYVIIPEVSLQSIAKKDNIFVNNLEPEYLYHEYNTDVLEELYQKLEAHSRDGEYSMLCIDDMGPLFRRKDTLVLLNRLIVKMRHFKVTIVLLCQNIYQLPKQLREIATNLITYNLGKSQMSKIFAEFYNYDDNQFRQIMKLYKEPHDWLLLNLKHNRLFFKFDKEIVFKEDDEEEEPKTEQKM
jgi:hypothetical protein